MAVYVRYNVARIRELVRMFYSTFIFEIFPLQQIEICKNTINLSIDNFYLCLNFTIHTKRKLHKLFITLLIILNIT